MKLYRVYTVNASTAPSRHQSLEAIHSMTCDSVSNMHQFPFTFNGNTFSYFLNAVRPEIYNVLYISS